MDGALDLFGGWARLRKLGTGIRAGRLEEGRPRFLVDRARNEDRPMRAGPLSTEPPAAVEAR